MIGPRALASATAAVVFLVAVALAPSCSSSSCPTIGCVPRVELTYARPLASAYQLSVSYRGQTFSASCPMKTANIGLMPQIDTCDATGLVVTGVDLGHGDNRTVDLTVSVDGGAPVPVTASLMDIANSRSCDVVCFNHVGQVAN
jgi:hypothetical protein